MQGRKETQVLSKSGKRINADSALNKRNYSGGTMALRQKQERWRSRLANTEETKNTNNQLKEQNESKCKDINYPASRPKLYNNQISNY